MVTHLIKYVSDEQDSLIEVPEGVSIADMVALKGDKEIGDKTSKIIVEQVPEWRIKRMKTKYRLIVTINFKAQVVSIRWFGTQAAYDKLPGATEV